MARKRPYDTLTTSDLQEMSALERRRLELELGLRRSGSRIAMHAEMLMQSKASRIARKGNLL
jgi:hypothetical protein